MTYASSWDSDARMDPRESWTSIVGNYVPYDILAPFLMIMCPNRSVLCSMWLFCIFPHHHTSPQIWIVFHITSLHLSSSSSVPSNLNCVPCDVLASFLIIIRPHRFGFGSMSLPCTFPHHHTSPQIRNVASLGRGKRTPGSNLREEFYKTVRKTFKDDEDPNRAALEEEKKRRAGSASHWWVCWMEAWLQRAVSFRLHLVQRRVLSADVLLKSGFTGGCLACGLSLGAPSANRGKKKSTISRLFFLQDARLITLTFIFAPCHDVSLLASSRPLVHPQWG